jgi:hypothetical protein
MSEQNNEIKEYAGGWMTERKHTDVPPFLRLAFPVIGLGAVAYLVLLMNGEVNHAERGLLVQKFNQATESSSGFMYVVAGLGLIYVVLLVAFVLRKFKED